MMKTSEQDVQELLTTAEGQTKFLNWIGDPITQLMLRAGQERARPCRREGESADYALGRSEGAFGLVDFLQNPTNYRTESRKTGALKATYGADEILKGMTPNNREES